MNALRKLLGFGFIVAAIACVAVPIASQRGCSIGIDNIIAQPTGPFAALVMYESGDVNKLTPTQKGIIEQFTSPAAPIGKYLETHAAKDSSGQLLRRVVDVNNTDLSKERIEIRDMAALQPRPELPYYVLRAGTRTEILTIPPAMPPAEFLTKLKKWGGE